MTTAAIPASISPPPHAASPASDIKGIGLGLVAAAIWGAYLAMAKAGVSAGLEPSDIAFVRYAVAGLVMLPWLLAKGIRSCGGVGRGRAVALSLLVGPLFILIGVGGYQFAPLAHGAVMQPAALTIVSLVLAAIILKDRPTIGRVLGILGMLAGLAIIAGPGLLKGGTLTPVGDAMFIVAGGMWAVFTLLTKLWKIGPLAATAAVSVLSAAVYVPGYLVTVGVDRLLSTAPSMLVAQVVVQGVLSGVVAVIAFTKATELLGAARATLFPAMVPAVAIILGVPLAGEIPTVLQLVGVGVVTAALLVAFGIVRADVGRVLRRAATHR